MIWKSAFKNCQSGSSYTRILVGTSTLTSLSSVGPRLRDLRGKRDQRRIAGLRGGGAQVDGHLHIAHVGFRVIDHAELDDQMAGTSLGDPKANQLDVFRYWIGRIRWP